MRLSQEQLENLISKLSQNGQINCPLCGHHEWNVNDIVIESREFHNGDVVLGGSIMPLVTITCRYCANTMFLNALQLGYVTKNTQQDARPADVTEESE